jgi:formiminotetrahydrofolate cyclodeaminase
MDSPTPGGGSAAALSGALSAALASMVANLTVGKKGYQDVEAEMREAAVRAQAVKDALIEAVDRDAAAFDKVMAAVRLPKATPEQAREKESALEGATKEATLVPLGVLEKSLEAVKLAKAVSARGFRNSLSDAGAAGLIGYAAGGAAFYNVLINLPGIRDERFKARTRRRAEKLHAELERTSEAVRRTIVRKFAKPAA